MNVIGISPGRKRRSASKVSWISFFFQALSENRAMVLFAVFLLGGVACGAILAKRAENSWLEKLDFLFCSNFKARAAQPLLSVFCASFASSFLFILFCFLCGLSMWGMFFIPFVVFFRGFGLGLTSGYIYAAYAWEGVLYNLVVILPGALFCCIAILLAAREGTRFSKRMAACGTSAPNGVMSRSNLKLYLMRFGAILALSFFAALIDLLLSACFAGLFRF